MKCYQLLIDALNTVQNDLDRGVPETFEAAGMLAVASDLCGKMETSLDFAEHKVLNRIRQKARTQSCINFCAPHSTRVSKTREGSE